MKFLAVTWIRNVRALSQEVSGRRLTAETVLCRKPVSVEFVVEKVALELICLRVLQFYLPLEFHQCFIFIRSSPKQHNHRNWRRRSVKHFSRLPVEN
jgi:hypothetical protein